MTHCNFYHAGWNFLFISSKRNNCALNQKFILALHIRWSCPLSLHCNCIQDKISIRN